MNPYEVRDQLLATIAGKPDATVTEQLTALTQLANSAAVIAGLQRENASLKSAMELTTRQLIAAETAVRAGAVVPAARPVSQSLTLDQVRAQIEAETDPAKKGELVTAARALRAGESAPDAARIEELREQINASSDPVEKGRLAAELRSLR